MRKKTAKEVREALETIIEENSLQKIQVISSDLGNEYTANAAHFKEKYNIVWFWLRGKVKAGLAEGSIKRFKHLLYRYMRTHSKSNWTTFYKDIVNQLNIRPLKTLKNRAPIDIVSPFSDIYSRKLLARDQETLQRKQLSKQSLFKKGDLVFVETSTGLNERGFDLQRAVINKIVNVDTSDRPYFYELEDLEGIKIAKKFYGAELKKAPGLRDLPRQIRHIYRSRRKNKKREYEVNFVGSKYVDITNV